MATAGWPEHWAESVGCGWRPDALSLSSGADAYISSYLLQPQGASRFTKPGLPVFQNEP